MKLGISIKLDVSKLDKARFFKGAKGLYCDLTTFVDTDVTNQYGDNGIITQATTKEERNNKVQLPICGNVKIFYTADSDQQQQAPAGPDVGDGDNIF